MSDGGAIGIGRAIVETVREQAKMKITEFCNECMTKKEIDGRYVKVESG